MEEEPAAIVIDRSVHTWLHQSVPLSRVEAAAENPDALKIAFDVGVLELASIGLATVGVALTLFALLLAGAAFFGYWMIKRAALDAARNEARAWLDEEGPRLIEEKIRRSNFSSSVQKPEIDMTEEQVEDVISEAQEIDEDLENGNGSDKA